MEAATSTITTTTTSSSASTVCSGTASNPEHHYLQQHQHHQHLQEQAHYQQHYNQLYHQYAGSPYAMPPVEAGPPSLSGNESPFTSHNMDLSPSNRGGAPLQTRGRSETPPGLGGSMTPTTSGSGHNNVVSSTSTGREDSSPVPQCSSSSFGGGGCPGGSGNFQTGDEIENSDESEFYANSASGYRYPRNSTPVSNGRERKRVLR